MFNNFLNELKELINKYENQNENQIENIKELLKNGADINIQNNDKDTAYDVAKNEEIKNLLKNNKRKYEELENQINELMNKLKELKNE